MLLKGFRFGMLLQLAVGPVCMFIFNTAALSGFSSAEGGVFGAAVADGLFILAAILGVGTLMQKEKIKKYFKGFGAAVMCIFGLSIILGQIGINLPAVGALSKVADSKSSFLHVFALTASNPLTIVFWAGVFSSKISEERYTREQLCCFGTGAILSTLFFLSITAAAGSGLKAFLPSGAISVINVAVGAVLIYFGIKMIK